MDDVTCSFIHFYLPKRKKTLRPSFMTTHTLPLTLLRHLLVILREPVISRQFSISPVFLFRYLLSDSGGQPDIMAPKNTEMDAWWSLHSAIPLGDYTRDEVEDYTGCNPLLMASCIEGGKHSLICEIT